MHTISSRSRYNYFAGTELVGTYEIKYCFSHKFIRFSKWNKYQNFIFIFTGTEYLSNGFYGSHSLNKRTLCFIRNLKVWYTWYPLSYRIACLCIMFFCRSSFENSRNNFYGILILSLNVLKKERKTERTKKKLLPCNADQFFSNSVAFTPACKTLVILVQGEIQ